MTSNWSCKVKDPGDPLELPKEIHDDIKRKVPCTKLPDDIKEQVEEKQQEVDNLNDELQKALREKAIAIKQRDKAKTAAAAGGGGGGGGGGSCATEQAQIDDLKKTIKSLEKQLGTRGAAELDQQLKGVDDMAKIDILERETKILQAKLMELQQNLGPAPVMLKQLLKNSFLTPRTGEALSQLSQEWQKYFPDPDEFRYFQGSHVQSLFNNFSENPGYARMCILSAQRLFDNGIKQQRAKAGTGFLLVPKTEFYKKPFTDKFLNICKNKTLQKTADGKSALLTWKELIAWDGPWGAWYSNPDEDGFSSMADSDGMIACGQNRTDAANKTMASAAYEKQMLDPMYTTIIAKMSAVDNELFGKEWPLEEAATVEEEALKEPDHTSMSPAEYKEALEEYYWEKPVGGPKPTIPMFLEMGNNKRDKWVKKTMKDNNVKICESRFLCSFAPLHRAIK